MTQSKIQNPVTWRAEIEAQFKGEEAAQYIQMIEEFLHDEPGNVVREFTAELIIGLRAIRNFTQRVQQDSDAESKAVVLFNTVKDGEQKAITVEEFTQTLLDRIAEARQLLDCLKFYSMALMENEPVRPKSGDIHADGQ